MKKLAVFLLMLSSAYTVADGVNKSTITLEQHDVTAYEALEAINEVCRSDTESDTLINPNKTISYNFQKIPCESVIKLIVQFDKEKP